MGRVNAPTNRRFFNPDADRLKIRLDKFEAPLHRRRFKNIQQTARTEPAAGKFKDGQERVDDSVFRRAPYDPRSSTEYAAFEFLAYQIPPQ